MTSHLFKQFKLFLKPNHWKCMAKSGISTELSKLPGNYKMTHHSGLVDYFKGLNLPDELTKILTDQTDSEMYLALKEKNGEWTYKSTHLIKGFPIGGNEWSFKVGEKFNLAENEPNDPKNFGRVLEMSVDNVGNSLVLEGQEETLTLAPLPKHYGEGIVMTRNIKGKNKATLKVYFQSVLGLSKKVKTYGEMMDYMEETHGETVDYMEETFGELVDYSGRKLHTVQWMGECEVRGLVFLCHGYGARATPYYQDVAEEAVNRGLVVFSHDHVGHGDSEGERAQVDTMDMYVKPVIQHVELFKQKYPRLPVFIVGHSMGGLITLLAILECPQLFKGAVLMGPLVETHPNMTSPFMVFLAKIFSRIYPSLAVGKVNIDDSTTDEAWKNKMKEDDKLYHGSFKAGHSHTVLQAMDKLSQQLTNIETPFLVLHGKEDKICTPQGSQKLYDRAASEDKQIVFIEKGYHNLYLESEPIKSNTIKYTFDWINDRIE